MFNAAFQSLGSTEKFVKILLQSNFELAGRLAGVGYSEVEIALTVTGDSIACCDNA